MRYMAFSLFIILYNTLQTAHPSTACTSNLEKGASGILETH